MIDLNYQLRAAANYIDKLGGDSKSYRAALNLAEAAKQCRDDGRCQYAIDHGAEGMAACPVGKCCLPRAPLASQQAPADVLRKIADLASLGSSYGTMADSYCDQIAEIVRAHLAGTTPNTEAPREPLKPEPSDSYGALCAFEAMVRAHPDRGIIAEHFLKKLKSRDDSNPEFLNRSVDDDWQIYRSAWIAARAALSAQQAGVQEAPSEDAKRLEWISHAWGGQRPDYAMHVLKRGGTGDASDILTFVDAALAAATQTEKGK